MSQESSTVGFDLAVNRWAQRSDGAEAWVLLTLAFPVGRRRGDCFDFGHVCRLGRGFRKRNEDRLELFFDDLETFLFEGPI